MVGLPVGGCAKKLRSTILIGLPSFFGYHNGFSAPFCGHALGYWLNCAETYIMIEVPFTSRCFSDGARGKVTRSVLALHWDGSGTPLADQSSGVAIGAHRH